MKTRDAERFYDRLPRRAIIAAFFESFHEADAMSSEAERAAMQPQLLRPPVDAPGRMIAIGINRLRRNN